MKRNNKSGKFSAPRTGAPAPAAQDRRAPAREAAPQAPRQPERTPVRKPVQPAPQQPEVVQQPVAKKKKKLSKSKIFARILLPLLAAAAVALVFYLSRTVVDVGSTYTFASSGTQYYHGTSSVVPKGSQLKVQEDGRTLMIRNGQTTETSLPVYLDGTAELVTTADMLYYVPTGNECYKLMHFSQILCRNGSALYLNQNNKQTQILPGFLYDGQDLYLFLEPVELSFNGYRVELPAFSFVEAVYGDDVTVFNYETKSAIVERSDGVCSATTLNGAYTVSLMGDSMKTREGMSWLLMDRPDAGHPMN